MKLRAIVLVIAAAACSRPAAEPAQLIVGEAGTVIVNSLRPTRIPVRALDERGQELSTTGVRYRWASGDSVAVADSGVVTCTRSSDAFIHATLGKLRSDALIRCRPVKTLHIPGPMQFHVGDTAQTIPVEALDSGGRPVLLLAGSADVVDSTVAALDGVRVRPLRAGATVAGVKIGDHTASVGVHVYERVTTLDHVHPDQAFLAVPLSLPGGASIRWRLPLGTWMLTMMPYEDEFRGLRLQIRNASCSAATLTRRRYVCLAGNDTWVVVFNPSSLRSASVMTGELLVRRIPK